MIILISTAIMTQSVVKVAVQAYPSDRSTIPPSDSAREISDRNQVKGSVNWLV